MKQAIIRLLAAKQGTMLRGHPWIFPKAIDKTQGKLVTGAVVGIESEQGERLGFGVFNEHSLYRVRVLAQEHEPCAHYSLPELIKYRLQQAHQLRSCLNVPNAETTAYRLFNSEADGLSGLTIDRFNTICVVVASAYWVQAHKDDVLAALGELFPEDEILWMPQVKALGQDGWSFDEKPTENTITTEVQEAGIKFQINFANAQKTGLFLDQRENHQRIAQLAKGKKVLDLYTYTGGFALHAAKAHASEVTAIDSSAEAIKMAQTNAALNGLTNINFIEADARDYLEKAGEYDIVILDPPKLVPSRQHLERAKNYYRFLHREVFKHMRTGTILMTCNCSSALSTAEFCSLVSAQALAVGKQARIVGVYGPSSCHPTLASFPEGNYLTAVLLVVV